jgi:hypothetical protein
MMSMDEMRADWETDVEACRASARTAVLMLANLTVGHSS